jgi:multidrug efflux pump
VKFNLSAWSLRQQPLVIFLMIITMALGAWSYVKLSRNEDPPFTIKTMVVSVAWPGATTEDTTQFVRQDRTEARRGSVPRSDRELHEEWRVGRLRQPS